MAVWSESLWGLRKTVLATNVEESDRAMAADGTTKALVSPPDQGEFQHQNCTVGTVHDSDLEGVVRIFVRHSYHSNELFTLIILFIRGATALLVAVMQPVSYNSLVAQATHCSSFQLTYMSCEDHVRSIESAMASKGKLRQELITVLTTSPAR